MPTPDGLMAAGLPAEAAKRLGNSEVTGLTATGSAVGDALALGKGGAHSFGTVAASTGAQLPGADGSPITVIYNGGASALTVYPQTGETINGGASFSVTNAKSAIFVPHNNGWTAILSA